MPRLDAQYGKHDYLTRTRHKVNDALLKNHCVILTIQLVKQMLEICVLEEGIVCRSIYEEIW
jgi:hypothetical protein